MVRKIRAKLVLELRAQGLSVRAIAAGQGISRNSIATVLEAADQAGITWDDIAEQSENDVYALLFPGRGEHTSVYAQGRLGHGAQRARPRRSDAETVALGVPR